ncbi:hypothetical protein D3C80_1467460 [compost metagenome]
MKAASFSNTPLNPRRYKRPYKQAGLLTWNALPKSSREIVLSDIISERGMFQAFACTAVPYSGGSVPVFHRSSLLSINELIGACKPHSQYKLFSYPHLFILLFNYQLLIYTHFLYLSTDPIKIWLSVLLPISSA